LIRYLTLPELLELHRQVVAASGGAVVIHSLEGLESALAQPRMIVALPHPVVLQTALGR
jgi:hypothetical protein